MEKIGDVIKKGEYKKTRPTQKFNAKCSADHFSDCFIRLANSLMVFTDDPYIVDDNNKDIINNLFFYMNCNSEFKYDLSKGILLIGSIGSGKTLIMDSFISYFNTVSDKIVTCVGAKDIVNVSKENGFDYLYKRPVFIDDIGKEQTIVNTYGTVSKPMEDLLNERYKNESLTFGTSNLKLEDMPYNKHTIDRVKQMMNIIVLPGKSRRK